MDTDTKVTLGLVASALILVGGYIGYREYARWRVLREVQQMVHGFGQEMARTTAQARSRRLAREHREDRARAHDRAVRTLSASQRCISGVVIEQHGSDYVQLTNAAHRPVTCTGRLASEPIR